MYCGMSCFICDCNASFNAICSFLKKKLWKRMILMWSFHIFRMLNNWQSNQLLLKMTQRKKRFWGTIIEKYKNYTNFNLTSTRKRKHAFKFLWRLIDVYVHPFETTYVCKKVQRIMNTFSGYKAEIVVISAWLIFVNQTMVCMI
jgi:hypothetical protein